MAADAVGESATLSACQISAEPLRGQPGYFFQGPWLFEQMGRAWNGHKPLWALQKQTGFFVEGDDRQVSAAMAFALPSGA